LGQKRRLWWRVGIFALVTLTVLILWPAGPIEGTYLSPDPQVSKHEFLLFRQGYVYGVVDTPPPIPPSIVCLGTYQHESSTGWVWALRNSNRKIYCKPALLFMRFGWDNEKALPATDPFQWRDPYFWKVRRVLQDASVRAFLASQNTNTTTPAGGD
jgi:hypothetical protein